MIEACPQVVWDGSEFSVGGMEGATVITWLDYLDILTMSGACLSLTPCVQQMIRLEDTQPNLFTMALRIHYIYLFFQP